nr:SafA/ExsA family spore coat assembly protein [Bacillus rubiinfantis]
MKIHIVQKGDTLWKIAKKYGVNFEELKKMNSQLSNPDMIMPGMKIKVPTAGGTIKKEGSINPGVKKEMPIAEHPFANEKPIIKEMPVKEIPIKEMPVKEKPVKEVPKAPYTPSMPLQIVPEIDINNYYMTNMTNMTVKPELPAKPENILPEVKEVPKKEIPLPPPPPAPLPEAPCPPSGPVMEAPCAPQEYCVPITPILPGPGFCPPYGGMTPLGVMPPTAGMLANMNPAMAPAPPIPSGSTMMPQQFDDESSAFIPQVPAMNPISPAVGGTYPANPTTGAFPQGMDPGAYSGMPQSYQGMQGTYSTAPQYYGQMPAYGQMPMNYGQMPMNYGQMPASYSTGPQPLPAGAGGYGPMAQGYPQMGSMEMSSPPSAWPQGPGGYQTQQVPPSMGGMAPYNNMPSYGYPQMMETPPQGYAYDLPDSTGAAMGDCGCGGPAALPSSFIPPTPPIYSAPYTTPVEAAQPPLMNPYGIGPAGTGPSGMSVDVESS